jgi:hypothetical protein
MGAADVTRILFHAKRESVPSQPDGDIHVWLYGPSPPYPHVGTVGSQAMKAAARLMLRPSAAAIDLLSIAMAVTAADTFVLRADAATGWSRSFDIVLPLANPAPWMAVRPLLQETLRFLSSDTWQFEFTEGGPQPPSDAVVRSRRRVVDLSKTDCVSLFSGGLDSAIGALDLLDRKRRPILVSHASAGDAKKQDAVAGMLPASCERMSVNTYPTWSGVDDDSMRTRSFQFLALGVLAGEAIAKFRSSSEVELFVCENGLIALNPPLTPRRIGSHSTRTAHPYFLTNFQNILNSVGLPVVIVNPYRYSTKGEMAKPHAAQSGFRAFASTTVSCGKWKRRNQQCGRCVPCLIRRASLHAANIVDDTDYQYPDLISVMSDEEGRDDLVAVQAALVRGPIGELQVISAGPLPTNRADRLAYIAVAQRGMGELRSYLAAEGFDV